MTPRLLLWLFCAVLPAGCADPLPVATRGAAADRDDRANSARAADRSSRRFDFIYDVSIQGLPPGAQARIWVPLARSTPEQCVSIEQIRVPAAHRVTTEPQFGNKLLYFEAAANDAGEIPVRVDYAVERFEVTPETSPPADDSDSIPFHRSVLAPPRGEVIRRLLPRGELPGGHRERARRLFDSVDELLTYDKSQPGWGRGDVVWACESGRGNCSDFHSVFIAACHDLGIPARFEIGFPILRDRKGGEVAGYHCWARFLDGKRWLAVDISEADKHPDRRDEYFGRLPPDRVQFTVGRDLVLEPKQQGGPVNFLIYPYVELDGPVDVKLETRFRFAESADPVCNKPRPAAASGT